MPPDDARLTVPLGDSAGSSPDVRLFFAQGARVDCGLGSSGREGAMTRTVIAICCGLVALALAASAVGQVRVRGYVRKDGTYVAPHYRSSPNDTKADNYSALGNYNPYTRKPGQAPTGGGVSYMAPSYAPAVPPSETPTYAPVGFQEVTVYQCIDSEGALHYMDYPRAGCDELLVRAPIQKSSLQPVTTPRFHGYACNSDCSGHTAGYEWAERKGIDSPDDCSGRSNSFVEGCKAYVTNSKAILTE